MTREDAIKVLNMVESHGLADLAKRMAIKALEHPEQNVIAVVPCGDCISRRAAKLLFREKCVGECGCCRYDKEDGCSLIDELPSVTPKPKTGRWIADVDKWGDVTTVNGYRCSECDVLNSDIEDYCPSCGAKMEGEEQE